MAADSAVCVACHGPDGNSVNPAVPSIAAQPAQFISTSLYMFREGNRKDPQMSPMAKLLANADPVDLGAYFSKQNDAAPPHNGSPGDAVAGPGLPHRLERSHFHRLARLRARAT